MHIIDLLNYCFIYRAIFHARFIESTVWKIVVLAGSFAITELLLFFGVFHFGERAVALSCLVALLIVLREDRIRGLLLFPVAFLLSGSVNVFFTYVFSIAFGIPYAEFLDSAFLQIISEIPLLLFLIILNFLVKPQKSNGMIRLSIPKYLILLLGIGSLFVLVGISQGFMLGKAEAATLIRPMAISFAVAVSLFILLILWQVVIERRARQYHMENELYRNNLEKQETHIRDIVESDQKLRSFRHDIRAHLTALEAGIEEGDLDFLKSYITRIKEENERIAIKKYTGIAAVDAVVAEWHQKALDTGTEWNWEGGLIPHGKLDTFDLCVIFSNLLSNAVEAAAKVESGREKRITVYCGAFQGNTVIRITNTYPGDGNLKELKTTKTDKLNHGYGLKNVEEVVKKAQGSFQITVEDGEFQAEIIL